MGHQGDNFGSAVFAECIGGFGEGAACVSRMNALAGWEGIREGDRERGGCTGHVVD